MIFSKYEPLLRGFLASILPCPKALGSGYLNTNGATIHVDRHNAQTLEVAAQ